MGNISKVEYLGNNVLKKYNCVFSPFMLREYWIYKKLKNTKLTPKIKKFGLNYLVFENYSSINTETNIIELIKQIALFNSSYIPLINLTFFMSIKNLKLYLLSQLPQALIIEFFKKRLPLSTLLKLFNLANFSFRNSKIKKRLIHNDLRTLSTANYLSNYNNIVLIDFEASKYERFTDFYDVFLLAYDDNNFRINLYLIELYIYEIKKESINRNNFNYITIKTIINRSLIKVGIRYLRHCSSYQLLNYLITANKLNELYTFIWDAYINPLKTHLDFDSDNFLFFKESLDSQI